MKRRGFSVTLLALAVVLGLVSGQAATPVHVPSDLQGDLNGAAYRIRVPANWNGTLIVYAHGYGEIAVPPANAPLGADVTTLLGQGYALAASAFRGTGWTMKEGIQDTVALTSLFRDTVGRPAQTIIWGKSMGGLMAIELVEKFPGLFDGAVSVCSPAAGTPRRFDLALDIALAYAVAFGWPDSWGTPGDIRDNVNWSTEVLPHIAPRLVPAQTGRWEFIRLVTGMPLDVAGSYYAGNLRVMNMAFAIPVRAELEQRAGGPVAQNIGRLYTLTAQEVTYLQGLGVDALGLLAQMNMQTNFVAKSNARNYAEHYVEPSGGTRRPVLTMHVIDDALAVPNHAAAYAAAVDQAGNNDLLVQAFTNGVGHCAFTTEQDVAGVGAMASWLQTGVRPGASWFTAPGFVPGYVPPPWRW